jgi:Mce-associated membrane protein
MAVDVDTAPEQPVAVGVEESAASVEDIDEASPRRQRRSPTRLALVFLLVFLAVLVGVGVWTGHQIVQERQVQAHRQALVAAGRQAALNLTTIDAASADSDIKRILDSSTGVFHDDFEKRSGSFIQAVNQAQSKTVGTVTEAGLESQDGDDAHVLATVAVTTATAGVEDPHPRAWRMRITVTQHAGGDPKVSNVEFVP